MVIDVITAQGVGEEITQEPLRMVEHVFLHLDQTLFHETPVETYVNVGVVGAGEDRSLDESRVEVKNSILQAVRDTPNLAIIMGYSGGALAAGDALSEIRRGMHPDLEVICGALIADPAQPEGLAPEGFGITGSRPVTGGVYVPTYWLHNSSDPICSTPALSPLRTLADQLSAESLANLDLWVKDLANRLTTGRWQPSAIDWLHPIRTFKRYRKAIDQANFYLSGGHFGSYRGAPTEELANRITDRVKEYFG